ncbi:MAG: hypothetical protein KJP09_04060 [Bacteroidia bacterium]|nr:hypothetical protein [Bacteroidia bacterium]
MKKLILTVLIVLPFLTFTSCNNDDDNTPISGPSRTFQLNSVSNPDISGTARFVSNDDGSVTIELRLLGTSAGEMHPAHVHYNSAIEGGGIAITLDSVDGSTGESSTTITQLDDNTPVTYQELVTFDGHVNVHFSSTDLFTLVAQGDIGENELTGQDITYPLNEVGASGISGNAIFSERVSGETLVTISLNGTVAGTVHATHVHDGSVATSPGAIAITLNTVTGSSGLSLTNVDSLDDNTPITYNELLTFDGYLNIHDDMDPMIIVAQGDIGQNYLN